MEQLIDISRPLMQGYLLIFVLMIAMAWIVFLPYRTAKDMKQRREEESIEDMVRMKADCLKPPEPTLRTGGHGEVIESMECIACNTGGHGGGGFTQPIRSYHTPTFGPGMYSTRGMSVVTHDDGRTPEIYTWDEFKLGWRDAKPSDYNTLGEPKARPSL